MKRTLSILLAVVLLLTALPLGAISVSAATYGNYTYTVSGGEVTITDCSTSVSGALTIPSTIEGYPVTAIGYEAFRGYTSLTSVTIPDSVTTIGNYAFGSCYSLTSVTIGDSVTAIGNYAFYLCTSLTSVTIPDSVTAIGNYAFYACDSLTSVTIGNSVTTISERAFYDCTSLTSVTIGDSVTTIGNGAFSDCYRLTSVTIGNSVTAIGGFAFSYCDNLTSITIPDSVTSIDDYAFNNCSRLTNVYYAGSQSDRKKMSIGSDNSYLTRATWHYGKCDHTYTDALDTTCNECGAIREVAIPTTFSGNSVSEDVSGLAFRFDVAVEGMAKNATTAIYDNATVGGYKLLSMGAVVTNGVESADIPAVYLCELNETTAGFAVRVIEIPAVGYDTAVTATPYIVLEIDGVATTIYGEAQTCSYNDVKN